MMPAVPGECQTVAILTAASPALPLPGRCRERGVKALEERLGLKKSASTNSTGNVAAAATAASEQPAAAAAAAAQQAAAAAAADDMEAALEA